MNINPKNRGNCMKAGCTELADFNVSFALRYNDKHKPATSSPIVQVCAKHSDVEWKDVYTEQGWELICLGFKAKGFHEPKREYSYLEITPIVTS